MTKCVHNKCSHPQAVVRNRVFCLNRWKAKINSNTREHTTDVDGPFKTRVPKHKLVYNIHTRVDVIQSVDISLERARLVMNINELRAHDMFIFMVSRYK